MTSYCIGNLTSVKIYDFEFLWNVDRHFIMNITKYFKSLCSVARKEVEIENLEVFFVLLIEYNCTVFKMFTINNKKCLDRSIMAVTFNKKKGS